MKLELIKYDNANCLEATWKEVTTTIQEFEKEIEVDGVLTKELVQEEVQTEVQVACVAYADVQIDLLRVDALQYGTSLDEYEDLIAEVEAGIVLPTEEEIAEQIKQVKLQECYVYLNSTDYKMTVDYFATLTVDEQNTLTTLRDEARTFIRENK